MASTEAYPCGKADAVKTPTCRNKLHPQSHSTLQAHQQSEAKQVVEAKLPLESTQGQAEVVETSRSARGKPCD